MPNMARSSRHKPDLFSPWVVVDKAGLPGVGSGGQRLKQWAFCRSGQGHSALSLWCLTLDAKLLSSTKNKKCSPCFALCVPFPLKKSILENMFVHPMCSSGFLHPSASHHVGDWLGGLGTGPSTGNRGGGAQSAGLPCEGRCPGTTGNHPRGLASRLAWPGCNICFWYWMEIWRLRMSCLEYQDFWALFGFLALKSRDSCSTTCHRIP